MTGGFAHARGLAFPIVADLDMKVIEAYKIRNPDNDELPLHSVYILDKTLKVVYRKVANWRPDSTELLTVIDYVTGRGVPRKVKGVPVKDGDDKRTRMAKNAAYWVAAAEGVGRAGKPKGLTAGEQKQLKAVLQGFDKGSIELAVAAWWPLATSLMKRGGRAPAEQVRSWAMGEAFLEDKPYQRDLVARLGRARAGSKEYAAAKTELIDLTGPKWGPLEAMFDAQHALDYVLDQLPDRQ